MINKVKETQPLIPEFPTYKELKETMDSAKYWQRQGDVELELGQIDLLIAFLQNYRIKRKILTRTV